MNRIERRALLAGMTALPLAAPSLLRAQASRPVQIGLLSDMSGPFKDVGGPGNRVAAELAIQDFGGSVLGRPITVRQADHQNRADVAGALSREWLDGGVEALADGGASSAGLAMQEVCRDKKRMFIVTGPATSDITGAKCSPYGMHFGFDTYALAHGTGTALTKSGGNSWYFITSDYAFGHALERDTMAAVKANGGQVLGAVRAPLNNSDFSGFLLQARASGAKIIGFALAGTDLQNCIKQASEFGLTRGGARIATLLIQVTDIVALGHKTCEGMVFTDSFYWNATDATRAWSARFMQRMPTPPGLQHAAMYTGVTHWLKAVKDVGGFDADAVAAKMKATPVNDMYNSNVQLRQDGRCMHVMNLWQVKPESEATSRFDYCKLITHIAPEEAWRPLSEGGCALVRT